MFDDYLVIKCLVRNDDTVLRAARVIATMSRYKKPDKSYRQDVALNPGETKEVPIRFQEAGKNDEGINCSCEIRDQ